MEALEILKTPADAESYSEHRAIRQGEKIAAPAPAAEEQPKDGKPPAPKAEEKPPEPPPKKAGESAEVPETPKPESQEEPKDGKPRRDRGAEARIAELIARAKSAEDERDALRRRLEEPQAPKPAAAAPPPSEPTDGDPKPKLKDYMEKAKAEESAVDVQERWEEDVAAWRMRRQRVEAQATSIRDSMTRKVSEARAKHDDWDAVTAGDVKTGAGLILTPAMSQYVVESDAGAEVAYHLGSNLAEARRIAALSPARQIAELAWIEKSLAAPPAPPPENTKPPVSKAPPPPRTLGGAAPPPPPSLAEAANYAEYKRLRQGKGGA